MHEPRRRMAEDVAVGVGAVAMLGYAPDQVVGDADEEVAGVAGEYVHVERAPHPVSVGVGRQPSGIAPVDLIDALPGLATRSAECPSCTPAAPGTTHNVPPARYTPGPRAP